MERKLWFRVFDVSHGNFVELGHFPEANFFILLSKNVV